MASLASCSQLSDQELAEATKNLLSIKNNFTEDDDDSSLIVEESGKKEVGEKEKEGESGTVSDTIGGGRGKGTDERGRSALHLAATLTEIQIRARNSQVFRQKEGSNIAELLSSLLQECRERLADMTVKKTKTEELVPGEIARERERWSDVLATAVLCVRCLRNLCAGCVENQTHIGQIAMPEACRLYVMIIDVLLEHRDWLGEEEEEEGVRHETVTEGATPWYIRCRQLLQGIMQLLSNLLASHVDNQRKLWDMKLILGSADATTSDAQPLRGSSDANNHQSEKEEEDSAISFFHVILNRQRLELVIQPLDIEGKLQTYICAALYNVLGSEEGGTPCPGEVHNDREKEEKEKEKNKEERRVEKKEEEEVDATKAKDICGCSLRTRVCDLAEDRLLWEGLLILCSNGFYFSSSSSTTTTSSSSFSASSSSSSLLSSSASSSSSSSSSSSLSSLSPSPSPSFDKFLNYLRERTCSPAWEWQELILQAILHHQCFTSLWNTMKEIEKMKESELETTQKYVNDNVKVVNADSQDNVNNHGKMRVEARQRSLVSPCNLLLYFVNCILFYDFLPSSTSRDVEATHSSIMEGSALISDADLRRICEILTVSIYHLIGKEKSGREELELKEEELEEQEEEEEEEEERDQGNGKDEGRVDQKMGPELEAERAVKESSVRSNASSSTSTAYVVMSQEQKYYERIWLLLVLVSHLSGSDSPAQKELMTKEGVVTAVSSYLSCAERAAAAENMNQRRAKETVEEENSRGLTAHYNHADSDDSRKVENSVPLLPCSSSSFSLLSSPAAPSARLSAVRFLANLCSPGNPLRRQCQTQVLECDGIRSLLSVMAHGSRLQRRPGQDAGDAMMTWEPKREWAIVALRHVVEGNSTNQAELARIQGSFEHLRAGRMAKKLE